MSNITEKLIDDCYAGYLSLCGDDFLSKEDWVETTQATVFIKRMKAIYKKRSASCQ